MSDEIERNADLNATCDTCHRRLDNAADLYECRKHLVEELAKTREERDQFDLEADGNAKAAVELSHVKGQLATLLRPIKVLYDHARDGDEDNQFDELGKLYNAYRKVMGMKPVRNP